MYDSIACKPIQSLAESIHKFLSKWDMKSIFQLQFSLIHTSIFPAQSRLNFHIRPHSYYLDSMILYSRGEKKKKSNLNILVFWSVLHVAPLFRDALLHGAHFLACMKIRSDLSWVHADTCHHQKPYFNYVWSTLARIRLWTLKYHKWPMAKLERG